MDKSIIDAIAYDRPSFGLTERKKAGEWVESVDQLNNPYSMPFNAELLFDLVYELVGGTSSFVASFVFFVLLCS